MRLRVHFFCYPCNFLVYLCIIVYDNPQINYNYEVKNCS